MKTPEPTSNTGAERGETMITKEREQLLHALKDEEFDALLDVPFLGEEMSDHYLKCDVCLARLERLMQRDQVALSQAEREEMDAAFPDVSGVQAAVKRVAAAAFEAIVKGVRVERWTAPAVGVAGGPRHPSAARKLVLNVDELKTLGIRPYVRLDLRKDENQWKAIFLLERNVNPREPARYIEPSIGTVELSLVRPGTKPAISVRLGSNNRGDFTTRSEKFIDDFQVGEERDWIADISVRSGSKWDRQ